MKRHRNSNDHTTDLYNLYIANEENLFNACEDVWALIGWAMTCSVLHRKRWAVYKPFLELLIDTVEDDYTNRANASEDPVEVDLHGSLAVAMGFVPDMTGSAGYKRIVRAIFANGTEKSSKEWKPMFQFEISKKPRGEQGVGDYEQTEDALRKGKKDTKKDAKDLDSFLANGDSILVKINSGQGSLGLLVNNPSLYHNSDSLMTQLRQLVNDIHANPGKYVSVRIF